MTPHPKDLGGDRSMRSRFLIALGMSSLLTLGNLAVAQQPTAPPAPAPAAPAASTPKLDYGPPISNEQAKAVAAAAVAEAKKNNLRIAISIVGPAGELVYFEKMDGTQLASTEMAQGKARTAVLYRLPSKAFADQYTAGISHFMTFPDKPVASEGGVLIVVSGKIIGAIGASGAAAYQDGAVATAGANAAK
ncbi:MAG: heme-binding protein [Alphaproteobacteria bacterium]|nr:MAG: heme-binding protein [Alphaproteobacteria bacterium]